MYINISKHMFIDAFKDAGRFEGKWSMWGLSALFEYLEHDDIELNVVDIDCEWSEHDSVSVAVIAYGLLDDLESRDPENYTEDQLLEILGEHTTCIKCTNGSVVIKEF